MYIASFAWPEPALNYIALSPLRSRARRLKLYARYELPVPLEQRVPTSAPPRPTSRHTHTFSPLLSLPAGGRAINNRQSAFPVFTRIALTFAFELSRGLHVRDTPSTMNNCREVLAEETGRWAGCVVTQSYESWLVTRGIGLGETSGNSQERSHG